jgi:hypothetical protein
MKFQKRRLWLLKLAPLLKNEGSKEKLVASSVWTSLQKGRKEIYV